MKILSENAIHDPAAPKFHYCLKEQNVPIFRFKSNSFVNGGVKLFLPPSAGCPCYTTVP